MFDLKEDVQLVCANLSIKSESWQPKKYGDDFDKMLSGFQTAAVGPWFQDHVEGEALLYNCKTNMSNLKLEETRYSFPVPGETGGQRQTRVTLDHRVGANDIRQ